MARCTIPTDCGDHLETGDADRAEIQFNDGTTLRLHFNTALEISDFKFQISDLKSQIARPPEIQLLRGQLWTKVRKTTNAPPYAVRTAVVTALARGTEFGVKLHRPVGDRATAAAPQPGTNLVAVLTVKEGAVDFFNAFGSVQATAMTESTARAGAPRLISRRVRSKRKTAARKPMATPSFSNWPPTGANCPGRSTSAVTRMGRRPSATTGRLDLPSILAAQFT